MILGVFQELEKLSDKLREYVIKNDNPVTMLGLFLGLLFIFIIGYNSLHKGE